jgi:DNA-directed RNA polymerase specialized sigma24 family protein
MLERIRRLDPRLCDLRGWSRKLIAALRDDDRWRDEAEIAAAMERGLAEYRALLSWIADAGLDRLEVGDFDLDDPEPTPPALTVAAISGAVASLPDPDRLLLTLRHEEGCSDAEIALVLDIPEVRVRQRVCESMHRLRAMLGRT